jgi:predicted DNA-binding WGR domain protein
MTTTFTVTAEELAYVDRQAGSDKFYRTYAFGTTMAVQYGRSGTFGTFKRTEHADADAAAGAARKQADAKFKKGYERVKSAVLVFDHAPTDSDLDTAACAVEPGASAADVAARDVTAHAAAVVQLNAGLYTDIDPAVLERVLAALQARHPARTTPAASTSTPIRPMLADTATDGTVDAMIADDRWYAQVKLDGERVMVEVCDGTVSVWNRQGRPKTSNVAEAFLAPFRQLTAGRWVFDGELVGRVLHLFDMVDAGGFIGQDTAFTERYATLAVVLTAVGIEQAPVTLVPCATTAEQKAALLDTVTSERREGMIFRKADAGYQAGSRSSVMLKHKLLKTADCVVVATSTSGKENATVAVFDAAGATVKVGSVSTIGKGAVNVGDVVEVKFLYVVDPEFPRMFQPRIVRVRHDKAPAECLIGQFADAGTNKAP